jgi:hypothetical protein
LLLLLLLYRKQNLLIKISIHCVFFLSKGKIQITLRHIQSKRLFSCKILVLNVIYIEQKNAAKKGDLIE